MDWEEFKKKVGELFKLLKSEINLECLEDSINYSILGTSYKYTKEDYESFLKEINAYTCEDYKVKSDKSYEVVITSISSRDIIREYNMEFYEINDYVNNFIYKHGSISDAMVYCILKNTNNFDYFPISAFILSLNKEKENLSMFNLLRCAFENPSSLQIRSKFPVKSNVLKKCIDSLLFNLCYKFNSTYKIATSINDIFGYKFKSDYNFIKRSEINLPKLIYKNYLIEQFISACSAEDAMLKFIGYYHIMEYFFEDVYKENLRDNLKNILIQPDFSATNDKDLNKIIKLFGNKGSDCSPGNEEDGLKLVLKNYVKINNLVDKLNVYKYDYIDYYKKHDVSFAKGQKVDLMLYEASVNKKEEEVKNTIFNSIAKRIYATRNSIVHGKSNELRNKERSIYRHFKNEKELAKEIPLMKAIAEEIIIKTAEEI